MAYNVYSTIYQYVPLATTTAAVHEGTVSLC
jgi:hypothetical protein